METSADHSWDHAWLGWHGAFAVVVAAAAILTTADAGLEVGRRIVVLVLLAALSAWYVGTGARVMRRDVPGNRLGISYVAAAVPLTVAMFALEPLTSVLFFLLYPQIWCVLPKRRAAVASAVTVVAVGIVIAEDSVFDVDSLGASVVEIVVGILLSIGIGLWISKIIEQSAERARLVAELATTRAELAAVSHEAGVLAERHRLARDLHDTLAQDSTSVLLLLRAARGALDDNMEACVRYLELAERTTSENITELRTLITALTPVQLEATSLPTALARLAERLRTESDIDAVMSIAGQPRQLPPTCEMVLLRTAQEALANVRKHADATAAEIELGYHEDQVTLRVSDNGRGFVQAADRLPDQYVGRGLPGLRSRIAEAGGEFRLETGPGAGVALLAILPVGDRT